jgi:hypothetical protein
MSATTDRRPPLLAFGLGWTEGAPMARVLARALPVPPAEISSPLPAPRFPLGCLPAAEVPAGAAPTFAPLGHVGVPAAT